MLGANRCFKGFLIIIASLTMVGTAAAQGGKPAAQKEAKMDTSCVATAKGPLATAPKAESGSPASAPVTAPPALARVGQAAPDFEANALTGGGFKNLKLSDYKGKWVVLCFYPGDFTFV
jgi:hypothetical protein